MADGFSKEKRSDIMRQVKAQKNKPTELQLIEVFKEQRLTGWRRNYKVKDRPDFVFPKQSIAVFDDGSFWHGHDCRNTRPSDNQDIGRRNENVTWSGTKRPLSNLWHMVGLPCGYGNVSLKRKNAISCFRRCKFYRVSQ